MKTPNELLKEWTDLRIEALSFQRAGIDDAMTDKMHERDTYNFNRRKEIEGELQSLGYELVDGPQPYVWSMQLNKI